FPVLPSAHTLSLHDALPISISIINGVPPIFATLLGALAGFIAGCITGILHTKGRINPLLSGILMMIALYSINLRIMGKPQLSLLDRKSTRLNSSHVSISYAV